ncbi:NAD(P)-dependent oxidoreductase [Halomonas sp. McH1-25]|nr:NAD(P)-dependent oxidoreductase [Halomonas sp. McH1-25]MCP1342957.1 NAD(P)-dependent oxidoreductase [Halomonas sp. FL8]MCP1360809.1 NAD(P)-dependent oxidoreductase [Halomonas sp. BBD45]MCP1364105.1 NAD(P)-dependent oxidoreductase [Halomonas sp. BBD48]
MNDNRANVQVGVIGIGLMGHGIASNIQKNGWALGFLDHPGNQPVDNLVAKGAKAYTSGRELAAHCNVVIICVTGSPQVEDVLFREDGVLKGLRPDGVIIDCSTAVPSSTESIAKAVNEAGGRFLDAPMTRTPKEAAEGRLNLIVGGERSLYEAQQPLLESFSENITYAGPVGSGHKLKLLHNFVSLGFSTVLAEAAACAQRGGVSAEALVEVLAKGGGAGAILQRLQPYILERDNSGFKFSISNAHKDLGYYLEMTNDLNARQSAAEGIYAVLEAAKASGHEQDTIPELISLLAEEDSRV